MPKGQNIHGYEFTKQGMQSLFLQMGYTDIGLGELIATDAHFNASKLDEQGFMPIHVSNGRPPHEDGHWIMLLKGQNNNYYLFDPMGEASASHYKKLLHATLVPGASLDLIPTSPSLHQGFTGYWLATVGLGAKTLLQQDAQPNLSDVAAAIDTEMHHEVEHNLTGILRWLGEIADNFKDLPSTDPIDATQLRAQMERHSPPPKATTTTMPWSSFSLFSDTTIRQAAQWAYDRHLGTPYKPGNMEATPAVLSGITVYRQTHGLAHTLRTMAYAQVIVEEARKAKLRGEPLKKFTDGRTLADVTPGELKKIMIAQAFFVAGREGEESDSANYKKYHELSRKAFIDYVAANPDLIPEVYKDQAEVDWYADIIEDKHHDWGANPAQVLINQGHMVDLVRVKQPPESYLENYFTALQYWIGTNAAESVFSIQRDFFRATYENVAGFEFDNKEPHLVVTGLKRYVMKDDQPVRLPPEEGRRVGTLKSVKDGEPLLDGERIMTVEEYLALPEVSRRFPGSGKRLEGGYPGLTYMETVAHTSSKGRALCETNVDHCLQQLQTAYELAKVKPFSTFEKAPSLLRRQANADEISAAAILKEIFANPNSIQDDHVMLHGQRFEEQFFRELLKKCDMAIVGSLLGPEDLQNVDKLMGHELQTPFHEPGVGAVSVQNIGEKWFNFYKPQNRSSINHALVHMMQDGSWYYRRINAIAQNRDSDSTFKEVVLTALLIPATRSALVATQPRHKVDPPKHLYRGLMDLSTEFKTSLMQSAEAIIANSTAELFNDKSAVLKHQVQLNQFTRVFGKTCLSTAANEIVTGAFSAEAEGHNLVVQIDDPDGLLDAQRVGEHGPDAENEYSVYLQEDVVLLPVEIITRMPPEADKIRLVAIKSPEFSPTYESGFALTRFMNLQAPKMTQIIQNIETERTALEDTITQLQQNLNLVKNRPVRDFWSRLSQMVTIGSDGKISSSFKNLLELNVIPALDDALLAVQNADVAAMKRALAKLPSDQQWANADNSAEANSVKSTVDGVKNSLQKQIAQQEHIPGLQSCKEALEQGDVEAALESLPGQSQLRFFTAQRELQRLKDELEKLENAPSTQIPKTLQQQRFAVQLSSALLEIETKLLRIEKKPTDFRQQAYEHFISQAQILQKEIQFLKTEKIRLNDASVDLSEFKPLEDRILAAALDYSKTLYNVIDVTMGRVKTAEDYCNLETELNQKFTILNRLEQCLGDSTLAVRQKENLADLKVAYVQLQAAYPKAIELGIKGEQFLLLIEAKCNKQLKDLKAPTRDESMMNIFWAKVFGEDASFLDQKAKYNELSNLKGIVNDRSISALSSLADLAKKSPTLIEQALGISSLEANIILDALVTYSTPPLIPLNPGVNLAEQLDKNVIAVTAALNVLSDPRAQQEQARNVVEQHQTVELH